MAELTLRCAPAYSPSDFRINLRHAEQARLQKSFAQEAKALEAVYHIMRFYTPHRAVIWEEISEKKNLFKAQALLAADMHYSCARAYEEAGMLEMSEAERKRAWQRWPFER